MEDLFKKAALDNYLRQKKEMRDISIKDTINKVRNENYLKDDNLSELKDKVNKEDISDEDLRLLYEQGDDEAFLLTPEAKEMRSQKARKEMLKMISDRYKNMGE